MPEAKVQADWQCGTAPKVGLLMLTTLPVEKASAPGGDEPADAVQKRYKMVRTYTLPSMRLPPGPSITIQPTPTCKQDFELRHADPPVSKR